MNARSMSTFSRALPSSVWREGRLGEEDVGRGEQRERRAEGEVGERRGKRKKGCGRRERRKEGKNKLGAFESRCGPIHLC